MSDPVVLALSVLAESLSMCPTVHMDWEAKLFVQSMSRVRCFVCVLHDGHGTTQSYSIIRVAKLRSETRTYHWPT